MARTFRNYKKHNKTIKPKRNVKVYRKGNVVVCVRLPIGYKPTPPDKTGGAQPKSKYPDTEIVKMLNDMIFEKLRVWVNSNPPKSVDVGNNFDKEPAKEFLKKMTTDEPKKKLLQDVMKQRDEPKYKPLFDALEKGDISIEKGGVRTDAAFALLQFINSKATVDTIITQIKDNLQDPELKAQLGEAGVASILKTLDSEGLGGLTSRISNISSSALKGMTSGAVLLASFLAPTIDEYDADGKKNEKKRKNMTNIQLLWYPQTHRHYKKGKSSAKDLSDVKYGDFVIVVEPEKFDSTAEFFGQMFNSVDDLLTNMLNGCTNMLCTEGKVKPQYYRKEYMQITNNQPQKDYEERMKKAIGTETIIS
jgi:hypothetical protein